MITEERKKLLDLFGEGRKQYKLMNFDKALEYFQKALEIDPKDGPSKVYKERCEEFINSPPPEDWDGVYIMKTK